MTTLASSAPSIGPRAKHKVLRPYLEPVDEAGEAYGADERGRHAGREDTTRGDWEGGKRGEDSGLNSKFSARDGQLAMVELLCEQRRREVSLALEHLHSSTC